MWYLYIIKRHHKYYTGITADLKNRICQHGNLLLLYKETFPDKLQAAQREKQLKGWSRSKEKELIAEFGRPVS